MGKSPRWTSVTPKTALSPATLISVPWRISVPPALAYPSAAKMIGFDGRKGLQKGAKDDPGILLEAHDPRVVGHAAVQPTDLGQVHAGTEGGPFPRQDADPQCRVCVQKDPGVEQPAQDLCIRRVPLLRPVQRDRQHGSVRLDEDERLTFRLTLHIAHRFVFLSLFGVTRRPLGPGDSGRRSVAPRPTSLNVGLSQRHLVDLPGHGARQRRNDLDPLGPGEGSEPLALEKAAGLGHVER